MCLYRPVVKQTMFVMALDKHNGYFGHVLHMAVFLLALFMRNEYTESLNHYWSMRQALFRHF